MWRRAVPAVTSLCVPIGGYAIVHTEEEKKMTPLRSLDYTLKRHQHGKARVRVLKVRRGDDGVHAVSEYKVALTLWSPVYERVFTRGDNSELVATDTQKNTVYVVAKRTEAQTPEDFGIALVEHLLKEYPILTAARAEVDEVLWKRAEVGDPRLGQTTNGCAGAPSMLPHAHGFLRTEPEYAKAKVEQSRGDVAPTVESSIASLVLLKTTQSGFSNYHVDKYTLLPPCEERCMATELNTWWRYNSLPEDFAKTRQAVRGEICRGFFGPPTTGVFSPSLQATIYDAGCLVLTALPQIEEIEIDTPNIHYLPAKLLEGVGEKFENDVFIPTSEPSGSINCIVSRGDIPPAASKEEAVAAIKKAIVTEKANSCPMAVRLAWHASGTFDAASGTGGSDGATMRFAPEVDEGANAGLSISRDILKDVQRKVPEMSTADVWALAGAVAVEKCGGPRVECQLGRRDATSGQSCPPQGRLPDASQGAAHLRQVFGRMGFDDKAIVALSGAHTLGRCHKTRSGFDGPWTSKPLVFDNEYFKNLLEKDWVVREWDGNFQYTDKQTRSLTMLPTDLALITDPAFKKHVEAYANDEQLFCNDFAEAYASLISLGCPQQCLPKVCPLTEKKKDDAAACEMREHCMHGSIEHAKEALKGRPNADVHACDAGPSKRTGLHKAAFWGHDHIIRWLLDDLKLNVDATDSAGDTALHDASRFGHTRVVKDLLNRKADFKLKNNDGMTALQVAQQNDKDDVIPLLLKA